jgi:hypothetical protein
VKTLDPRETKLPVIVNVINQLAHGRSVVAGSVTLTVNVATTTVSNDVIPAGCFPQLTPASANAATEMGNGTCYVSAVAKGSFTITHANAATTARTFHWFAVGG